MTTPKVFPRYLRGTHAWEIELVDGLSTSFEMVIAFKDFGRHREALVVSFH
jgi:hypothetical protein